MKGWGSRARGGAKGRDRNGVTTSLPHNIATALGVHGLLLMCPPCSCPSEDRRAQKEGRCARDARLRQLILKCRGDSKECWEPSNAAWKVGAGERTDEVGGGRLQMRSCANPGTLPALSLSTEATSLWSR